MVYTTSGCLFLILFGIEIAYKFVWLDEADNWTEEESLIGYPIKFNISGHIIPIVSPLASAFLDSYLLFLQTHGYEYDEEFLRPAKHGLPTPSHNNTSQGRKKALVFMAVINVAVVISLGSLSICHAKLVTNGETSIEAYINASETKRLSKENKIYINPYSFGAKKNWKLFLGLVKGRCIFSFYI